MLAQVCQLKKMEDEIRQLQVHLEEKNATILNLLEENRQLREELHQKDQQIGKQNTEQRNLSVQLMLDSKIKGIFTHYTGFSYDRFCAIYRYLVPSGCKKPFVYKRAYAEIHSVSLVNQLLLTILRLRLDSPLIDLAFRFNISVNAAGVIFNRWLDYMYLRFGSLCMWPHRDKIIENMPKSYFDDYPTSMAIIDCTELYIEKPSSLQIQSQCYSDYKSGTTVKGLIAIDPRGSVIFVSELFSGSMSDREVVKQSGFLQLLGQLVASGKLLTCDAIMADKGFDTTEEIQSLGLSMNIPPRARASGQMQASDVELTKLIAKHRVHVERAIARIKKFRIVRHKIAASIVPKINSIWFVCSFLTNFHDTLMR